MPDFQSPQEEDYYHNIFDDKLTTYITLLDKVKEAMYGTGYGNYANLPGSCQQVLEKITSDLINSSTLYYRHVPFNDTLKDYTLGDKWFIF